jgi:hypothetical protein
MSIATLKRKTNAVYAKVHSHGHYGLTGFSLNGGHRGMSYIGKEQLRSKVVTPFKGTEPRGHGGTNGTYDKSHIIMGVGPGTDIRGQQYKVIKPSVVSSREQMNRFRWCCADIVRTQSGIDMGSQDAYIAKKSAANVCVLKSDKPTNMNASCNTIKRDRLDCENNYSKDVTPIDSSLRTLAIQKECSLKEIDPSKIIPANNGGGCSKC